METDWTTIVTFVLYVMGVFVLAALSHRLLSKKSFMGEYFLGSRGLGSWALAFTFAATSASGGSFTGFPSFVYSYGWVLALWIASYMVVPICTMGAMGKRLNNVARKSGAITIPDVLRDRFSSPALGITASIAIIFFTTSNLVAQFKAGAIILEEVFGATFLIALIGFATIVVFYTAYGGFRAVVWTDVMQGIVMGVGVLILVPVILSKAGGLRTVSDKLVEQPPLAITSLKGNNNDLAFELKPIEKGTRVPRGIELVLASAGANAKAPSVDWSKDDNGQWWIRITLAVNEQGEPVTTAGDVQKLINEDTDGFGRFLDVKLPYKNDGSGKWEEASDVKEKRYPFVYGDEFIFGPGRKNDGTPFHHLGFAISFFFMWAISGMGQPGPMVRLMAFKESRTLRRSIITVTFYYSLIYLPLVFVFVAGRTLLTDQVGYLTPEHSDNAMALLSIKVVGGVLGAIMLAAPFSAVMSTVDSFLLVTSSACVRDIYQRSINPKVSENVIKYSSYATTVVVGIIVTLLTAQKPAFLQRIIVFTGGGFAATFLCPMFLGIYWKNMTRYGALASMIGGFGIMLGLTLPDMLGWNVIQPFGLHPIFWGLFGSFFLGIVVSKLTGPPPEDLIDFYFRRPVQPPK